MKNKNFLHEIERIKKIYKEREQLPAHLNSPLNPAIMMIEQEKERTLLKLLKFTKIKDLKNKKILEIGAGYGNTILKLISLGFKPSNIYANELLEDRLEQLHQKLPAGVKIIAGDASGLQFPGDSFDIVMQSMVFSSILDPDLQEKLAQKIWNITKSKGGILWYDFVYNNPQNKNVMGFPFGKVKKLFPQASIKSWKITLLPPLARAVCRYNSKFYTLFNSLYFLRTHLMCWIYKP